MVNSFFLFRWGHILFLCLLLMAPGYAAETAEARPDIALLEFLGSFAQADEAWLDTALDEEQDDQSDSKNGETVEDTHNE